MQRVIITDVDADSPSSGQSRIAVLIDGNEVQNVQRVVIDPTFAPPMVTLEFRATVTVDVAHHTEVERLTAALTRISEHECTDYSSYEDVRQIAIDELAEVTRRAGRSPRRGGRAPRRTDAEVLGMRSPAEQVTFNVVGRRDPQVINVNELTDANRRAIVQAFAVPEELLLDSGPLNVPQRHVYSRERRTLEPVNPAPIMLHGHVATQLGGATRWAAIACFVSSGTVHVVLQNQQGEVYSHPTRLAPQAPLASLLHMLVARGNITREEATFIERTSPGCWVPLVPNTTPDEDAANDDAPLDLESGEGAPNADAPRREEDAIDRLNRRTRPRPSTTNTSPRATREQTVAALQVSIDTTQAVAAMERLNAAMREADLANHPRRRGFIQRALDYMLSRNDDDPQIVAALENVAQTIANLPVTVSDRSERERMRADRPIDYEISDERVGNSEIIENTLIRITRADGARTELRVPLSHSTPRQLFSHLHTGGVISADDYIALRDLALHVERGVAMAGRAVDHTGDYVNGADSPDFGSEREDYLEEHRW